MIYNAKSRKLRRARIANALAVTVVALSSLSALTSCNDWLDVQPDSQVEDTELFKNENGFKEALTGVYSSMVSANTYSKEMTYGFVGILGQEWDYYYSSQYDDVISYNYSATYPTNFIKNIWATNYNSIANVNNLLAHIDNNTKIFSKDNHDVIKGEALALRAFLHFDLLRCFGVSYEVNPQQPSIPYCTGLTYRVFPQLKVEDVASKIITDLKEAEKLLKTSDPIVTGREITELVDNGYLINRQLHLNYYAVKGLEARVYMWKKEYAEARDAAREVIDSEAFSWSTQTELQTGQDYSFADEHLFALNNLTLKSDVADQFFTENSRYSFAVTRDRLLEYFDNVTQDYRYTFLFKSGTTADALNNRYLNKYDEPTAADTYYKYKMPLLRLSEMYLILSEAEYRLNGDALTPLNDLRIARNLLPLEALPVGSEAYFTELIREYRRELIGEGQLFFLYKRLNRSIVYYSTADAVAEKIYTFPLPLTETEAAQRENNR